MRFFGVVGYGIPTDEGDGVWQDRMTERTYKGEVSSVTKSLGDDDKVNTDVRLQNRIDVMADAFALENFSHIKYVSWMGSLWAVNSVTVERPRLLLALGGAYSGPRVPEVPTPPSP